MLKRRNFLKSITALGAGAPLLAHAQGKELMEEAKQAGKTLIRELSGVADRLTASSPHVVVIGGGYGGATAAKYLRMWSNGSIRVTLVEQNRQFVSCPISNLVLIGEKNLEDITVGYGNLSKKWGVDVITDKVTSIDPSAQEVRLNRGDTLKYDRLVLSPGVDFLPERVEGLAGNEERIPHAWKAGPQTSLLRRQLDAMEDGGVYALHIPLAPFRCPPGPYERISLIANYFKRHKPRSKVLAFDANPDIQSKKGLFLKAWEEYGDIIEYQPNARLMSVNAQNLTAEMEFDTIKADVLNVVPPMRAGRLTDFLGVELVNGLWVDVDFHTLEVRNAPKVHVLGDATLSAPAMPKSGHMANQHAKVAAAAIIELLAGRAPNPTPLVMNTCYSLTAPDTGIHVTSVHQWDPAERTFIPAEGAGGVSDQGTTLEGRYTMYWAQNIWADMLA